MGEGVEPGGRWVIWTRPQRAVVAGVLVVMLGWCGYRAWRDRMIVPMEPTGAAERAGELEDRLDPNIAPAAELAMLPGVGAQTARDIVDYRDRYRTDGRGDAPFLSGRDLLKVKGVGVGLVRDISPYLRYPTPATSATPTIPAPAP